MCVYDMYIKNHFIQINTYLFVIYKVIHNLCANYAREFSFLYQEKVKWMGFVKFTRLTATHTTHNRQLTAIISLWNTHLKVCSLWGNQQTSIWVATVMLMQHLVSNSLYVISMGKYSEMKRRQRIKIKMNMINNFIYFC